MSKINYKEVMVMGAGGVGGFFGGRLGLHTGRRVSLVARGEHLLSILEHGLIADSKDGDFTIHGPASDDPVFLPDPDLIIFTVKSHDTDDAIEKIKPKVKGQTQILPLQNGIENIPKLIRAFGEDRIIPAVCRIGVHISEPGKIKHSTRGRVIIGESDGARSKRIVNIKRAFEAVDVTCRISQDIEREIWLKFSWNAIFNMVTAAENRTVDYFYSNGEPADLLWNLADEILITAKRESANISRRDLNKIIHKTKELGEFATSTLHDRRSGKKLEYDAFTGALLRLGEKHGLNLPEYQKLHNRLKEIDAHAKDQVSVE
ncbi:ketopantoate reductase family protein [Rhodohalobacter sp. SW132]|uniref:ketopantoate reductase family protein n=1 Tax=Rhodohalobacter sp. SW132 TaxID=2293433 RepID=UPI000E25A62B|nr:ketopantoate reductase family protein [Rhodohalobacter sp. SW132]REL24885.1 ketopantoate reductase family protein [Rhodohalobacter sp. SW132]